MACLNDGMLVESCNMTPTPRTFAERFAMKTRRDAETGCLIWQAAVNSKGYGRIRNEHGRNELAHRVSWRLSGRALTPGLELDHVVCETPLCVEPEHLTEVTHRANVARGRAPAAQRHRDQVCGRGHPMTTEHGTRRNGKWYCNTCRRDARRERGGATPLSPDLWTTERCASELGCVTRTANSAASTAMRRAGLRPVGRTVSGKSLWNAPEVLALKARRHERRTDRTTASLPPLD